MHLSDYHVGPDRREYVPTVYDAQAFVAQFPFRSALGNHGLVHREWYSRTPAAPQCQLDAFERRYRISEISHNHPRYVTKPKAYLEIEIKASERRRAPDQVSKLNRMMSLGIIRKR